MNRTELADRIVGVHEDFARFVEALDEPDFMYAPPGKWPAGRQLDHLVRAAGPVATAFALPKFVPALLFGAARRPSADYDSVVEKYRARLAAGGRATGRYVPPEIEFARKAALVAGLRATSARLARRVARFTEAELDRYRLPHPLLGRLTMREMLYFTIYHAGRHHRRTAANLNRQ